MMKAPAHEVSRMRLAATSALVSLAALTIGCKQTPLCPPLDACGGGAPVGIKVGADGKPTDGDWVLAEGHPSCAEDLYIPASDPRLQMANPIESGAAYPEPAVYDWCVLLVTGPGAGSAVQVFTPRLYQESPDYGFVTLKFQADGHFSSGITLTGTFLLELPAICVKAFGATDVDPADPTNVDPDGVCHRLQDPLYNAAINTGAYKNLTCKRNTAEYRASLNLGGTPDPGGCLCRYDINATGGPAGTYELLNANTIRDFPDAVSSNFPQNSTYCLQGDRLQLTGADGAYLFDQKGLRTLDLVRGCNDDTDCVSKHCDTSKIIAGQGICH
jgi:hypothetical protein